jgi:hypothetical protein
LKKIVAVVLLGIATGVAALAQIQTPEIDSSSAAGALVQLAGTLVVVRGFRRK